MSLPLLLKVAFICFVLFPVYLFLIKQMKKKIMKENFEPVFVATVNKNVFSRMQEETSKIFGGRSITS